MNKTGKYKVVFMFCWLILSWAITSCGASSSSSLQEATPIVDSPQAEPPSSPINATPLRFETVVLTIEATSTVGPTAVSTFDEQDLAEIAYFEKELQRSNLDPAIRAGYEDQIATLKYWMARRAEARDLAITPGTEITAFASDPTSTPFPRGILPFRDGLTTPQYIDDVFVAENGWTDGQTIGVYAGAVKGDEKRGAIVVLQNIITDGSIKSNWYFTPVEVGSIHIVSEQDNILVLQAIDGTLFSFDLNARTFK